MKKIIRNTVICVAVFLFSVIAVISAVEFSEGRQAAVLGEVKTEKVPILSAEPAGILGVYEKQKVKVTPGTARNRSSCVPELPENHPNSSLVKVNATLTS